MGAISSRRTFIKALAAQGALLTLAGQSPGAEISKETKGKEPMIDRTGVNWKGRLMYLRPYHPTWLTIYYGKRNEALDQASQLKWGPLIKRIEKEQDLKIRIIEGFDDACAGCRYLHEDCLGSIWGIAHTCKSAQNPEMVAKVTQCYRRTLKRLELDYGDEIPWRDLVKLLKEKIPVLDDDLLGSSKNQEAYEQGLADLMANF